MFGLFSLPLPPSVLGAFGLVRLKRADGAVRVFISGCWLEGLAVCGRSLFVTGLMVSGVHGQGPQCAVW